MQIREVMSRDVKIITPDTLVRDAARIMRDADTGFLPVGENDRLVGTVTDRDIALRAAAEGRDPNATPVRETMSPDIVYCFEDQDTAEAAKLMANRQIHRLAILNRDKRLVGVLSVGDIAERTGDEHAIGEAMEGISQPTGKPRNV
ncbi:MAG: CBS domain-containing protein [Rhodospirillales bacterium]|nr:CBS domain-containing protein [Rhodospirillales bacterium]